METMTLDNTLKEFFCDKEQRIWAVIGIEYEVMT